MSKQMFRIDGKAALITGAGRGLGRAMAVALAGAGADCVLVARRREDLLQTVKLVEAEGRRAVAVAGDVTDEAVVPHAVDAAVQELGRLDILVFYGGLYHLQRIVETCLDIWLRVLVVNLFGYYLL
jgi:2-deoxy-D-gluconate 3-dehydrogenase